MSTDVPVPDTVTRNGITDEQSVCESDDESSVAVSSSNPHPVSPSLPAASQQASSYSSNNLSKPKVGQKIEFWPKTGEREKLVSFIVVQERALASITIASILDQMRVL